MLRRWIISALTALLAIASILPATHLPSKPEEYNNDTPDMAQRYARFGLNGTALLVFRDIPQFVEQYVMGTKTLDYGCGAGRSTSVLTSMGLNVLGVDISEEMLKQAIAKNPDYHYLQIQSGILPVPDHSYDFVFSSLVLFDIASKDEIAAVFREIYRILKPEGVFIAVTGSEEMYRHAWLSLDANYPENADPKSGDVVRICLKDIGAEFYDYFWTDLDYRQLFEASGFQLLRTHFPLGKADEGIAWVSEMKFSPYVVYVVKKS